MWQRHIEHQTSANEAVDEPLTTAALRPQAVILSPKGDENRDFGELFGLTLRHINPWVCHPAGVWGEWSIRILQTINIRNIKEIENGKT